MDVGAVGGWSWSDDTGGGYDQGDATVSMQSASKVKARATETVKFVDHQGITQESAPARKKARVRATDSKESVTSAARRAIPQGNGPKAKKEGSQRKRR